MKVLVGGEIEKKLAPFQKRNIVVVTDNRFKKKAKELFPNALVCPVKGGEEAKTVETVLGLYTKMIEAGLGRDALLVALGGGVIGDLAGFAAATYLRGIDWINIPTTLVAQVDAAIGGKTGVNHPLGKNLIGSFHAPKLVLADPAFLETLPKRDRISGLGEVIKYGLIADPALFRSLKTHWQKYLDLDPQLLEKAIRKCARLKLDIVAQDEKDTKGIRQMLNFGHTFGHALEAATQYDTYRHGEAVIEGMRIALRLSVLQGHLAPRIQEEVDQFLRIIPIPKPKLSAASLLSYAQKDKKKKGGKIGFVLLSGIGKPLIDATVSKQTMEKALCEF